METMKKIRIVLKYRTPMVDSRIMGISGVAIVTENPNALTIDISVSGENSKITKAIEQIKGFTDFVRSVSEISE